MSPPLFQPQHTTSPNPAVSSLFSWPSSLSSYSTLFWYQYLPNVLELYYIILTLQIFETFPLKAFLFSNSLVQPLNTNRIGYLASVGLALLAVTSVLVELVCRYSPPRGVSRCPRASGGTGMWLPDSVLSARRAQWRVQPGRSHGGLHDGRPGPDDAPGTRRPGLPQRVPLPASVLRPSPVVLPT